MKNPNKVKDEASINEVRSLYEENGLSLKAIARKLNYSINTVRKIIRKTNGYESDSFDHNRFHKGGVRRSPTIISEVDGEVLYLEKKNCVDGYNRVCVNSIRIHIHRYEARKVYKIKGINWPEKAIVHHIDSDRGNFKLNNLVVMAGPNLHQNYHGKLERAMYHYLKESELLPDFYRRYPELKLKTLEDMLKG